MNFLSNLFKSVIHFFNSDKVKKVEQEIEALTPEALTIVQALLLAAPNKTVSEVVDAYKLYGVPLVNEVANNETSIGNALLNLGTAILGKQKPSTAVNILNTVIQLAVSLTKAK